ncbi:hypothetical protein ACFVHB_03695 [Kitasatospora sp. NPDC127111]|uniref:hypothetical protein n=1 Tax=Kitasatospora sp. NPDC127111 TaxID=3345363 RepID=UPI0036365D57
MLPKEQPLPQISCKVFAQRAARAEQLARLRRPGEVCRVGYAGAAAFGPAVPAGRG